MDNIFDGREVFSDSFLPVWCKLNVYPQFSRTEDRVASLKELCTASTKRLSTQCLLHKYKSKI